MRQNLNISFYVKWNDSLVNELDIISKSSQLEKWLKYKLNLDSIIIKREF